MGMKRNAKGRKRGPARKRRPGVPPRPQATLPERWKACLHEGGHVAAERLLNNHHLVGAFVIGGHGAAYIGPNDDEACTFLDAMAIGAGSAAEELVDLLPAPSPLPKGRPEVHCVLAKPAARAALGRDGRRGLPDHVRLARYAIRGHESKDGCWAGRIHLVKWYAYTFVREHRKFIFHLAERLYLHGLILPHDVEEVLLAARQGTTERENHVEP